MLAAQQGEKIPDGWALDRDGSPTNDPQAVLDGGSLYAIGGMKGAMLAMMIELLCCALTGASLSPEVDSYFTEQGNRPRVGQLFIVIDPARLAGMTTYFERVETLIGYMSAQPGARSAGTSAGLRHGAARIPATGEIVDTRGSDRLAPGETATTRSRGPRPRGLSALQRAGRSWLQLPHRAATSRAMRYSYCVTKLAGSNTAMDGRSGWGVGQPGFARRTTPLPFRGRLGGDGVNLTWTLNGVAALPHPHPRPPLEGEGIE